MLKSFSVENFKSFYKKQEISFEPNKETNLKDINISNNNILKGLALFGENGGGKTALIEAFHYFLNELIGDEKLGYSTKYFIMNDKIKETINFSSVFQFDGDIIEVSFSIAGKSKLDPIGYKKKISKEIFKINGKEFNRSSWIKDYSNLPEDLLLIRFLYSSKYFTSIEQKILDKFYAFLGNSIIYSCDKKRISGFNKSISFSIDNLLEGSFLSNKKNVEKINSFLNKNYPLFTLELVDFELSGENKSKIYFLLVDYEKNNKKYRLPFRYESNGNIDLITIIQFFIYLEDNNGIIFVDEFNSTFHSELSKMLVTAFMETHKKSQFIFVSQDTNVMSSDILRADQICFVNRNSDYETEIEKLSDFKTRPTQNYQKMYRSSVVSKLPSFLKVYNKQENK